MPAKGCTAFVLIGYLKSWMCSSTHCRMARPAWSMTIWYGRSGSQQKATLPLDTSAIRRIALVGPNANATTNLLGGYHDTPPFTPVSPLTALRAAFGPGRVAYAKGCAVSDGDNASILPLPTVNYR